MSGCASVRFGYNARMSGGPSQVAMAESVSIFLNGECRTLLSPVSVRGLIQQLGLDQDAVAIERNREIVRRLEWPGTHLRDGDRIEIVHFVGGG